jgi:AcrR family transcriptional regulator
MRKKPEERKKEILDAADRLFAEKGYDNTSTNDILEAVGIARGALYHHFKSKEEIMDSLIERYSHWALDTMRAAANDRSRPVKERLIRTFLSANIARAGGAEIMRQIHRPQNALMHEKMQKAYINGAPPILAEIIRDGIGQGIFHTEYPYECMEMMVIYTNTVFDREIVELTGPEKQARITAFFSNLEKLLGAEPGTFKDIAEMIGRQMGEDQSDESE